MRGKSILLIAGGALVLALLVGMKMFLADDAGAQPPAVDGPVVAPVATAAKPGAPVRKVTAPVVMHAPVAAAVAVAPAVTAEVAPAGPTLEPPPGIDDPTTGTKLPIADKATLRDQMNAVEPYVRQCLELGGDTTNATGTALLTWTVASKNGQAIVESSGVDYDATDLKDEKLLACLAATANQMHFQAVPGALPVIGRRKLTITNGQLAEQQFVSFSRIY